MVEFAIFSALMAVVLALAGAGLGVAGFLRAGRLQSEFGGEVARIRRGFNEELARVRQRLDGLETLGRGSEVAVAPEPEPEVVVPVEETAVWERPVAAVVEPESASEPEPGLADDEALTWLPEEEAAAVPEAAAVEVAAPAVGVEEAEAPALDASTRRWSFEEALGGKVFVWIGGVALALAGAYLVKYSWENQLLSVGARLTLAAGFGLAMIGVGTWLRTRAQRVAAALVGAGVADLYGVTFAATGVYHFLGPTLGFGLMAGVTAGAVFLSLRHGQFVALLGLVGGFCTPLLIGDARPAGGAMLGYLLVLQIGLVVVTRQRGWIGLSAATLGGSLVWGLVQAITGTGPEDRLLAGALALGSAAVFILNATRVQVREAEAGANRRPITPFGLALSALSAAVALLGIVTVRGGYQPQELAMVGLLGAGAIALARFDVRYLAIPWLTMGLSAAMAVGSAYAIRSDESLTWVMLGFAMLYGLGGYAVCWTRERAAATSHASVSAVGGMLFLMMAAVWAPGAFAQMPWVYAGVAAGYAALAWARVGRRPYTAAAGPLGLAACGAAAGALTAGLDGVWRLPALALLAAGAAWATRTPVLRRHGVWAVGLAAGAATLGLLNVMQVWWALARGGPAGAGWPVLAVYAGAVGALVLAVAGLPTRWHGARVLRDGLGVAAVVLATVGGALRRCWVSGCSTGGAIHRGCGW